MCQRNESLGTLLTGLALHIALVTYLQTQFSDIRAWVRDLRSEIRDVRASIDRIETKVDEESAALESSRKARTGADSRYAPPQTHVRRNPPSGCRKGSRGCGMIRAPVNPSLLRWARERAGIAREDLMTKFKKLPEWEDGQIRPTLKQAEAFARAVHAPVGYLFLSDPPEETVPIPDFRTFTGHALMRPSPNLLDTIYACQERQSWYRDFARVDGGSDIGFVGSASIEAAPETVAAQMRETLAFDLAARRECPTWTDALRLFIRQADETGVLVMVSGIVMSNNLRGLEPAEFRGFALCDPLAPLIFVNGKDTKAAQMFTLAHELAHIWLGASALSNSGAAPQPDLREEEVWCNAVAAELLVPLDTLRSDLRRDEKLSDTLSRLARNFKVSTLVILRRLLDVGWLTRERFDTAWAQENERLRKLVQAGGGDFYRTTVSRVGRRFARALVVSTLEGQTLYRDAFRMLGVKKTETFNNIGREAGVMR